MTDPNKIGTDRQYKTAEEAYDAEHGTYKEIPEDAPEAQKFATGNMPQAPDPSPFKGG